MKNLKFIYPLVVLMAMVWGCSGPKSDTPTIVESTDDVTLLSPTSCLSITSENVPEFFSETSRISADVSIETANRETSTDRVPLNVPLLTSDTSGSNINFGMFFRFKDYTLDGSMANVKVIVVTEGDIEYKVLVISVKAIPVASAAESYLKINGNTSMLFPPETDLSNIDAVVGVIQFTSGSEVAYNFSTNYYADCHSTSTDEEALAKDVFTKIIYEPRLLKTSFPYAYAKTSGSSINHLDLLIPLASGFQLTNIKTYLGTISSSNYVRITADVKSTSGAASTYLYSGDLARTLDLTKDLIYIDVEIKSSDGTIRRIKVVKDTSDDKGSIVPAIETIHIDTIP